MNKAYKVIWSKAKNCYVVASELAKRHTKAPSVKGICTTVVAGVLASIISCGAVMPMAEAYTYDNQTTTVTELQADTNPTTITNNSNVTVSGDVNLPKAGSTTYSYSNNSDINLNFDMTGISTKQDAVNKLMALGNSLTLAQKQGYGDGWASSADSGWTNYTYYHDYHYSDNKSFAVHDGISTNGYVFNDTVNRTGHDVVTGNYCIKSRWIGGGYDDAEDTFLVVQIDTTTGDILTGISEYYVTDMGGHWDDYPVASTQDFTVNTSDSSSPHLNVTSNSNLNVVGNSGSGTVANGDITLTGGNLTANGSSTVTSNGDIQASSITASDGSTLSAKNIKTTSGDLNATGSEVTATETVQSAGVIKAGKLTAPQMLGAGNGMSTLGGGLTVAGQVKGVTAGTADTDAVNLKQMRDYVAANTGSGSGGTTYTAGNGIAINADNVISAKAGTNVTVNSNGINVAGTHDIANGNTGLATSDGVYDALTGGSIDAKFNTVTTTGKITSGAGIAAGGRITGVTAGTADTDAVNYKQMRDYVSAHSGSGGGSTPYVGINSTGGTNQTGDGALGTNSIAIGKNALSNQGGAIAIGEGATNFFVPEDSGSGAGMNVALGKNATSFGGIAIGFGSHTGDFANENRAAYATAVGPYATVLSSEGASLGHSSTVGKNATGSVAIGNASVAQEQNVVSFGHKAGDTYYSYNNSTGEYTESTYTGNSYRRLINIADGINDNDATNMKQLNTEVTNRTNADTALSNRIGTQSADGNYIKKSATNNVVQNIAVLDTQLKNVSDSLSDGLDTKANVSLNNITDAGKAVIRNLAKDSVKVEGGDNIDVATSTVGNATVYTVNVETNGQIANNNTGILSGRTAYSELRPSDGSYVKENQTTAQNLTALDTQTKANSDAIDSLGDGKANIGLDNITDDGKAVIRDLAKDAVKVSAGANVVITANAEGNATSYQVDVEGTGKVKANDTGLISGGTAYTELRPVDGNYVQQNNTTAQNLTALDEQLKGAYDAIDQASADTDAALATKADKNANNLTDSDVDAWQRKLGDGTIGGDNDTGLVTGSTVKQALTDLNSETDAKLDLKANADASNVSQFAQEWADAIGTGTVSADDTRLVTGKTVYEAMHDAEGTMDIKEINVKKLKAEYINVDEIEGDHATFNTIDAKEINTTDLNAENIYTTNLTAEDIKTNTFEAIDGKIDHLQSTDIKTETLEATQKIKTKDFEATGLTELNRLNVNGTANFKDNVNIEKDLTVKGDTLLKGDLTVEGTTDLQDTTVNGTLTVNGDEKVNGNQEVTGKSTVGSQEVLGDSVIDGNQYIKGGLKVDGPSEFGGKVTTHDDVEVGKDLLVNGDARIKGDTTMEGDAEVQGDFRVEGDTNLKDTLVDGTLKVTGEATFDDKVTAQVLEVLGDATVDGSQSIKENLTVEGKTELKGDVRTGKDVEVGRDLTVDGKSTFKDDVLMEKNLAVQGNTSMDGDLSVGGNTTVEKDFTVNGQSNLKDTLVDGTLEVNKEASFHDNVLVDKHLGVAGSGIFGGDLSVGGDGNVAGTFDIGQDLTVEGTSTLKGDVAMSNNADVAGNFHVGGESQLDGNTTIGTDDAPADLHITGNAQVDKNLVIGGDTNLAGNVEIGGDLHAENGTSYFGQSIWNEGQEHQVEINQTGIRVGLNSTHMDAHGIYAGGHNWDEANAAMHEDGRIKGIYGNFEKDVVIGGKLEAGEADIKGNTNIGGNLQVAGDSNFGGNVVVQKNLAVKGDSVVGGNSYVAGDQVVNQNLQVNGDSNFAGNVLVNKNLVVKGDTVVNGTIIADNALIGGKDFNQELGRIDDKIYTAGANAAALASLAPVPTDEDTKWNLSAAVGNYHNQTAGAVGVFYKPQDNVMFNVRSSFGSSSSDNMIGGGVSVALDRGDSNGLTKQAMARKISSLEDKLKDYDAMKVALVRMQQKIDALTVNPNLTAGFPDVPEDHWANSSVSTLHGNGLVQGYPDGEFKGDRPMTRYEYAEMLCNALLKGGTVSEEHIREYAPELRQIRMNRQQAGQAIPKAIEALE